MKTKGVILVDYYRENTTKYTCPKCQMTYIYYFPEYIKTFDCCCGQELEVLKRVTVEEQII